jgi:hypothetical protein
VANSGGRSIQSIAIEPFTNDLDVLIEDGYWVETFACHPNDDESWHIRENATRGILKGYPKGLKIESRDIKQVAVRGREQPLT